MFDQTIIDYIPPSPQLKKHNFKDGNGYVFVENLFLKSALIVLPQLNVPSVSEPGEEPSVLKHRRGKEAVGWEGLNNGQTVGLGHDFLLNAGGPNTV